MYERRRNLVTRADRRLVNVARPRGQLFVCKDNCCCGRVEDGIAPVPADLYHGEWERRRLRNLVHLTVGGCLGPCALANVALLLFDGQAIWLHSINTDADVLALYDYIDQMLDADSYLPPPAALAGHHFTASAWQARPDGQSVDDYRPRRAPRPEASEPCAVQHPGGAASTSVDGLVAMMPGEAAIPRKNGELVFEAPWQGRAFGMAVALNEVAAFPWEEFRQRLIDEISAADERADPSGYYERWLSVFETVLEQRGVLTKAELDERAYQFEFGERDEVF